MRLKKAKPAIKNTARQAESLAKTMISLWDDNCLPVDLGPHALAREFEMALHDYSSDAILAGIHSYIAFAKGVKLSEHVDVLSVLIKREFWDVNWENELRKIRCRTLGLSSAATPLQEFAENWLMQYHKQGGKFSWPSKALIDFVDCSTAELWLAFRDASNAVLLFRRDSLEFRGSMNAHLDSTYERVRQQIDLDHNSLAAYARQYQADVEDYRQRMLVFERENAFDNERTDRLYSHLAPARAMPLPEDLEEFLREPLTHVRM